MATTTEPTYITAANLAKAPTGSSDARGKIVAHSTLILIVGTVRDAEPRVERTSRTAILGYPSSPDPELDDDYPTSMTWR